MTRILRKDPLIEAVCEFHLDAPDWDWTVPGVVYKRISDLFPEKTTSPHINFHVEQTPEGVHPSAHASLGRIQFWSKDRKQLVQIGPQHFSVHQLKPYTGWPIFKSLIERILTDYESEAPCRAIQRMSLRYVNRLPLPNTPYQIEQLVRVMPQIPDSADQLWSSWFQQVEIFQPEHSAVLALRSGYLPGQQFPPGDVPVASATPEQHMLLDLLFAHAAQQPIERDSVSAWLEKAHSEIETLFFKSLQPDYLTTFEPEESNENTS